MKKMLLVFPHPDDESFHCGGTIAKYAAAGWQVHLVCATRGEAGECGPYIGKTGSELGDIRQEELVTAGKILGLSSIQFLGCKDGALSKVAPGLLENKIFVEMVRLVPDVVITFEQHGITNHPDHIKLTVAATVAFQRYVSDVAMLPQFEELSGVQKRRLGYIYKSSLTECLALKTEPRLYYACMPQSVVDYLLRKKILPELSFGKPMVGVPDKLVTTVIDTARHKGKKIKALVSHRSQEKDVNEFLSLSGNPLITHEYFIFRMSGYTEVYMGKNDHISNGF